jgi:hypothetical protein
LLSALGKYPRTDTVLAVLLNQPAELEVAELSSLYIPFSQVWLVWCESPDHEHWAIQGDIRASSTKYRFTYPAPRGAA